MKLSSKSILSPSRSREPPQISLQSSLSRRLRNNGSMKGGQASPMFPTIGGKRRGCGFDNPEPSSPKVTCIGQVRVKTKKQGKKMRSRSKRRGGEALSFRKNGGSEPDLVRQNSQSFQYQLQQQQQECLKHRNQRWVHLPLTICEALREFTCFFPCRSSCVSKEEKNSEGERSNNVEKNGHGNLRDGSCGAAFARWLVALQEGDGKGRDIELVMKEEDYGNRRSERSYSQRKHVLEDIDVEVVVEEKNKKFEEFEEEEEEKGRVSICVPPKNALLLMRCRSDPVKMAALANRFWESPVHEDHDDVEKDEEVDEDNEDEVAKEEEGGEKDHFEMEEDESTRVCFVNNKENNVIQLVEHEVRKSCEIERDDVVHHEPTQYEEVELEGEEKDEGELGSVIHQGENDSGVSISTLEEVHHADLEKSETEEEVEQPSLKNLKEGEENDASSKLYPTPSTFIASELQNGEAQAESEAATTMAESEVTTTMAEPEVTTTMAEPKEPATMAEPETEASVEDLTEEQEQKVTVFAEISSEREDPTHDDSGQENGSEKDEREGLPECLLQMMCEPKVSMEVSKETWVCSTDFVRWLPPEKLAGKPDGGVVQRRVSMGSKLNKKLSPQRFLQPPRYSCSFPVVPAEGILAGMIEQKVGPKANNGYKPFVLTRCKSEPVRLSARA
ncbi:hypothetical protein TanjilG_26924 [Lupinus angustifolius]|uniref:Uncharacterized protein n=1 Tax=Lupinus angustifolius TaxID=3871 RepID=A0A4P1RJ55_LUPAN|nr:hypothetical protein TanjilG_26924 [Lupinus angustifolius]